MRLSNDHIRVYSGPRGVPVNHRGVNVLSTPIRILVVDDDEIFAETICDGLAARGYDAFFAVNGEDGIAEYRRRLPDVVLLDQNLPDLPGIEVCRRLMDVSPDSKVIFATAFGSYSHAVKAVKAGAYDYLTKPLDLDQFFLTVRNAAETLRLERRELINRYERSRNRSADEITGVSPQAAQIRRLVELAAGSRSPVLITGETGVGKAVVARAIHKRTGDDASPVTLNCAAIPESLIEAELFGHVKGAFTGAQRRRKGVFELASGGTLILDEIGEMPLNLQKKLLTVLEEQRLRPLGGEEEIQIDVRVIAITNRDLDEEIANGGFRQDLYYRLAVINVHVPPLRERPEDIAPLTAALLKRHRPHVEIKLSPEQLQILESYPWPGNVRELRNILERSLILSGNNPDPAGLVRATTPHPEDEIIRSSNGEIRTLEDVEQEHILAVMRRLKGNRRHSADALGISLSTLRRRLSFYRKSGIAVPAPGSE